VARITPLDKRWAQLMALCETEATYRSEGTHPRLLRLVSAQIDTLAQEMGFSQRCIATRDFRAERDGGHITRILTD
jgi:hypothetical protein